MPIRSVIAVFFCVYAAGTALAAPQRPLPPPPPEPAQVQVILKEWEIAMADRLPAGTVRFHITNAGTIHHSFQISGNGVIGRTGVLGPGQSAQLTVTLGPGDYVVDCPVDQHYAMGMKRPVWVR
ncbi:MAG: hypothetical protein ACM3OC_09195 [Deltaproteobacteria bacterium]